MPLLEQLFTTPLWPHIPLSFRWWGWLTRLGEAQILLPALVVAAWWLAGAGRAPRLAVAWVGATVVAAAVTTISKLAFIGFEWGYAPLDYSGISGHAMFAAAILPVLAGLAVGLQRPGAWRAAVAAGYVLALLVGISRIKIGAHSLAEVLLGLALGGLASALALRTAQPPAARLPPWVPLALAGWLVLMAAVAPPSRTHDIVTRLALKVSGRPTPYTKTMMRLEYRLKRSPAASPIQSATRPTDPPARWLPSPRALAPVHRAGR